MSDLGSLVRQRRIDVMDSGIFGSDEDPAIIHKMFETNSSFHVK